MISKCKHWMQNHKFKHPKPCPNSIFYKKVVLSSLFLKIRPTFISLKSAREKWS